MSKVKAGRKIVGYFRKRGRIVPLFQKKTLSGRITKGAKEKAARSKLKKKAKAMPKKIDPIEDRIDSIKAVRKHVKGRSERIGFGSDVDVFQTYFGHPNKVIKVPILQVGPQKDMLLERFVSAFRLSEKGLAPKTHLLATSKSTFLVQRKVKKLPDMGNKFMDELRERTQSAFIGDALKKETLRRRKLFDDLRGRLVKAGARHNDLNEANVGLVKGKLVSIDSGDVEFSRELTAKQIQNIKKLIIKKKK